MFFNDIPNGKAYKIGLDGKVSLFLSDSKRANGQAFGPDGRLYAVATGSGQVLAYDADGKAAVIADGIRGNDLVVRHDGGMYVTEPSPGNEPSKVWFVTPSGEKKVVDVGLKFANGVTLSPDQSLLYVAESRTHLGLQLPDQGRRVACGQAEVFSFARPRLGRRRRQRRRVEGGPRRPFVRGDPHGRAGLRPGGPRQLHHSHTQQPDREPLFRRHALRQSLRHLRRPRLPSQGEDPRCQRLREPPSSPPRRGCEHFWEFLAKTQRESVQRTQLT